MKKLSGLLQLSCATWIMIFFMVACKKDSDPPPPPNMNLTETQPGKVATDWFNLEAELIKATPSFGPGVAGRALAYSGLALYESVVPGMPAYQSVFNQLSGSEIPVGQDTFYWPACANAALAKIMKNLFAAASPAVLARIDSLESLHDGVYQTLTSTEILGHSNDFGKVVGDAVFKWSKTDGFLDAIPPVETPVGEGKWIPTPPAFAPPIATNWGTFRSFAPDVASLTQPPAPIAYSTDITSDFYKMVDFVYQKSLSLSKDDSTLVKSWGDMPGNYNGQTHLNKVLTQLLQAEHANLEKVAFAYAAHGMAVSDAAISVFTTKYTYWLIRPVSYIRSVMGKTAWNTVIPTPPHPEYPAAHAVISGASEKILESLYGENFAFTDHSQEALYGARSYSSFQEYAEGSGWSRVLGGLHYKQSVDVGLDQGKKVAGFVLQIPFKK